jgi:hypothetical protein
MEDREDVQFKQRPEFMLAEKIRPIDIRRRMRSVCVCGAGGRMCLGKQSEMLGTDV